MAAEIHLEYMDVHGRKEGRNMIIVKMNNSTVECSIAASELREIGLTPESLLNEDGRSGSFMSQLNKEVGEQLGYDPEQEVLLMSKNMMSDGSVRIFAVKMSNEDIDRTAERIRMAAINMMSLVDQNAVDIIKSLPPEEKAEALGHLFMGVTEQVNRIYTPEETGEDEAPSAVSRPVAKVEHYTVSFASLEAARRFSKVAAAFPVRESALYKSDERYYLVMSVGNEDENLVYEFRKVGIEYALSLLVDDPAEPHIVETGDCIIAKDAVGHLSAL